MTRRALRTLVTGGAGFIGSHLVDALVARGDEVTVVDDLSSGCESNLRDALAAGATLHRADIRDPDALGAAFAAARPQVVFHLAAQVDVRISIEDPARDARINVEGTVNVLEAARRAATSRLVFSSTGGAIYGESDVLPTPETVTPLPMAGYGQSKFCAERYLELYARLYGLSSIALRFGNVYGPRQDPHGEAGVIAIYCGRARAGRPLTVYGEGTQTRDYIYVADLVDAILAAAASDAAGPMNVGTEEPTSVLDLVRMLGEIHGADGLEAQLAPARLGEVEHSCLDCARARAVLGWRATTPIKDGLARTYAAVASAAPAR